MQRLSASSVAGCVRPENEDAAFVGPHVAVVADGVGGSPAGEVASASTAYVFASSFFLPPRPGTGASRLERAYADARALLARGEVDVPARAGMATTMSAVVPDERRVLVCHVGDTRVHLWRDGCLSRLTTDHTWVEHMLSRGVLRADQAVTHPYRHVVVRSLAAQADSGEPDVLAIDVEPGDRLLLTTDGVHDVLGEGALAAAVAGGAEGADRIVEMALRAGSRDNVTALLVEVLDDPPVVGDGLVLGALRDPAHVVDPAQGYAVA
ncbi:protein phosphatase 2C domain-containing protein [Nocardioides sp. GY 10127]|uniref:PP2C family protein-serine/threonine phosphatase n=1 Tax=Nocardioides sp. GY 10127 TaxID=2569762 RepID=UPI0014588453|nr:protein phosphatase 2C domain-containing protein [Nocardioides sp. GY 10127]